MPNQNWTLTVSYSAATDTATITDQSGGSGDKTIYQGESNTITFVPGNGVRSVTSLSIKSPNPMPAQVTVTQWTAGNNCVAVDTNALAPTDAQVDVEYGLNFRDSNGNPRSIDPKLINLPTARP